ncbi:Arm DNA-binding domain-containing protein [Dyadobacter chenwenxiniae]|uniref:Arm DNA-binding domain-containing protein n=1 Tax=Dyadobacter chenwenxiniae TaxID=2906456 RepID=UPI0035B57BE4
MSPPGNIRSLKNVKDESNQKLSILFWLFKAKATKDGKAPIYVRITIEGLEDEISLGKKVHPNHWCSKTKKVTSPGMEAKTACRGFCQERCQVDQADRQHRCQKGSDYQEPHGEL